jgi:hypothetical protein
VWFTEISKEHEHFYHITLAKLVLVTPLNVEEYGTTKGNDRNEMHQVAGRTS